MGENSDTRVAYTLVEGENGVIIEPGQLEQSFVLKFSLGNSLPENLIIVYKVEPGKPKEIDGIRIPISSPDSTPDPNE